MNGSGPAADLQRGRVAVWWWPNKFFGPTPNLKEINVACWSLAAAIFLLRFCIPAWIQFKAGKGSIPLLPVDFIYLYGIGHIVKDFPSAQLYNYALQQKVFADLYYDPTLVYGPSPYPPFVGLFFSLFARVSFRLAFFLWMFVSLALYAVGILVTALDVFPGERVKASMILCFSIATFPFFWGVLINGQLASVAVCAVGIAIYQERHGRPFASGLALSVLAYKPTLLLLIVPMLLLTRRFKAFTGFVAGSAILMLVATAFMGVQIWPAYAHFLSVFNHVVGVNGQRTFELYKFIEIGSCLQAIFGPQSRAGSIILISVSIALAITLVVLLSKSASGGKSVQSLAWATTLTWTLLLNVYVPLYDSVLVTIAIVLTLGAALDLDWKEARRWIALLSLLIFVVSWVTYDFAKSHKIQLLSIAIAALGLAQFYMLYRANRNGLPNTAAVPGAD
jgi:Glycosyltransferase family 87